MKKIKLLLALILLVLTLTFVGCKKNDELKEIKVAASDVPHAEILNAIKDLLKEKGYDLKVTILDWQEQNAAVVAGDYDANYFQHEPYLLADTSANGLKMYAKVHYEPLGIYKGKSTSNTAADGTTFEICDDSSNGVRAFQLLFASGVLDEEVEKANNNFPYDEATSTFTFTSNSWTSSNGKVVTLVSEDLLVARLNDYDFALLPCNTALTGGISASTRVYVESDPTQLTTKANGIAARVNDYNNDEEYKSKIDALCDVLLSKEVEEIVKEKYNGVIICDSSTQIDLRNSK